MSQVRYAPQTRPGRHKPSPRIIIARGDRIRSFTLRPWLALTAAAVATGLLGLYLAATGYLVFRDDLLTASTSSQTRLRETYENRITELRTQLDRVSSRQLVTQQALDAKMQDLMGRQQALDQRQSLIGDLGAAAKRLGIDVLGTVPGVPATPASLTAPAGVTPLSRPLSKPPVSGNNAALAPVDTTLHTAAIAPVDAKIRTAALEPLPPEAAQRLGAVEASLQTIETNQVAYMQAVAADVSSKASRINSVLSKLGHNKTPKARAPAEAMGGPFVPFTAGVDGESFKSGVAVVTTRIQQLAELRALARQLPLGRPADTMSVSSGFGSRSDPFLGRLAIHEGVDFLAEMGSDARVTAAGTVIVAEWNGGYGNMVEVDHGNGVTTRYGHLSRILVKPGQKLELGAVVGRVGSTGRSTGPHLHYEVRLDDEPIDPMKYIQAGGELRGLL